MPNIICTAKECKYNNSELCVKRKISVEGLFSRSQLGTFCESFKLEPRGINFSLESSEIFDEDKIGSKAEVTCNANYCTHNLNSYCQAKKINIKNENARYRSETECESFALK